ncbi:YdcF family protein [filamentous cyanobacterium LEGE 11480]|uniref:YdcF family protein n=1 Tax=Romeriopsis navalis LEGE 11480 TaxID=2777977 RepID=A0A928VQ61_9CYAN|nr:YdcF family protein [Romeriopsis navalis]MBE9032460.1 YdcF family protein [Romeriopsis navalis LEGE 11480]
MRLRRPRIPKRCLRLLVAFWLGCSLLWSLGLAWQLHAASQQPIDTVLVLGGSIHREIHATRLANRYPDVPILISKGSPQPCIRLIFERRHLDLSRVWLEECAHSTFTNFYFSLPVLQQWQVHKVRLVTSGNHMSRASRMAKIILGSHGIWVEPEAALEVGRPGNRESRAKMALDVLRSLGWAIGSQVYQPRCQQVVPLSEVNLTAWRKQGFKCQHQKLLNLEQ